MELRQLWAVIVRRWWLILLPAAVALILTLSSLKAVVAPPVTYSVSIRFTASQVPPSDPSHTFQDQSYIPWLASEYAITNLAAWMRTESFAREIDSALQAQGKTITLATVCGPIVSDSARSIMTLYLQACNDPENAKLVAQAAINVLQQRNQAYFPQLAAQRTTITPLDAITVAPSSAPITSRLSPLLRIGIGLVAGLALAFLVEYLDPTIHNRREVEALGFAVIAEIPRG